MWYYGVSANPVFLDGGAAGALHKSSVTFSIAEVVTERVASSETCCMVFGVQRLYVF